MYAEVNFGLDDDGLKREQYRFTLIDSQLVFDSYTVEERATRRHKWRVSKVWQRLGPRSYAARIERPPLTDVLKAVAKQELMKKITVVEDYNRGG